MIRYGWPMLLAVALSGASARAQPLPDWAQRAVGSYAGLVFNNGRMECHHTVFAITNGGLTGHYWIDDVDPFEGDLTAPTVTGVGQAQFTWTDRYGRGVEAVTFNEDFSAFQGLWGVFVPMAGNVVSGRRGTSCTGEVS